MDCQPVADAEYVVDNRKSAGQFGRIRVTQQRVAFRPYLVLEPDGVFAELG